jgi:hypothetical protein
MKPNLEKEGQTPHFANYAQDVTSDPGSFTPLGHWQSLLYKYFYGSTDLLEAMVKKVAVFKANRNCFSEHSKLHYRLSYSIL